MARFGIRPKSQVYGISMPEIRQMAKEIKKDHELALLLFKSGIHEAKMLATIIAEHEKITEKEVNEWVKLFDSWDIVDQCCMNLFWQSKKTWNTSARQESLPLLKPMCPDCTDILQPVDQIQF